MSFLALLETSANHTQILMSRDKCMFYRSYNKGILKFVLSHVVNNIRWIFKFT